MEKTANPRQGEKSTLDRDIERFRQRLATLKTFLMGNQPNTSLEEFDLATEELILEVLGRSSVMVEAYEYAQFGEAGGLVNLTEEAPEGANLDHDRQSLRQRQRVLESCVADLEARRAEAGSGTRVKKTAGPKVAEYMGKTIRSISLDATLREAGTLLHKWKIGSLLVESEGEYVGSITETELSREVIATGVNPSTTTVKTCMREPILTIESSSTIVEVVNLMKEKATRHVAVTESGKVVGVISVSDVLRYYSGVV